MRILKYNDDLTEVFQKIEFEELGSVKNIINDVKVNGDEAVKKYSKEFDGVELENFVVGEREIEQAYKDVDEKALAAIKYAISNVEQFAKSQLGCVKELELDKGTNSYFGHKIVPIEKVGCYVPGGNYALPSSAIMTVVPARVAGVKKIVVCSPKIQPATIVAAHLAGADEIYRIGGVQAIAAMAYGTESVEKVDKIVGPGNKYVTSAKKQVYGECGIDFLAGPSEVLIVADETANLDFVVADMLAQNEHDKDAKSYLVCFSEEFANKVKEKAHEVLQKLSTKEIAKVSFENSYAIVVDNLEQAVEVSERRAPEHLELCFKDAKKYVDKFKNYGSLFIGNYCAEVFGDYCSGTNHTLPTNQVSRYCGGLSVFDFIKIQTYQNISKVDIQEIGYNTSVLAEIEGLSAHKLASDLRYQS